MAWLTITEHTYIVFKQLKFFVCFFERKIIKAVILSVIVESQGKLCSR